MEYNKSSNPTLGGFKRVSHSTNNRNLMTLNGTSNKTLLLLVLVLLGGYLGWTQVSPTLYFPLLIITLITGIGIGITLAFKPMLAKYLAPLYAIVEGLFLGFVSMFFELMFPGIITQAILLTISVIFLMLVLYRNEIIKVTQKFKSIVILATGAIFLTYLVSVILNLFGSGIPLIHSSGTVGIIFSVFVVIIASLNLLLDFDFIDKQIENKVHKDMEWYGAFALLVTIVWLYLEILKLLAKTRNRN